jgi:YidC/Oxa1 family membrane protein insertase
LNRETILRYILVAVVAAGVLAGYWMIEPYLPLPRSASKSPPAAAKPDATKPSAEKPAAEKPVAEKPAAEKPAAEKPAGEKAPAPPVVKAAALQAVGAAAAAPAIVLGSALSESKFDLEAEVTPVGAAVRRLAMSRREFFKTVADARKPPDERAPMELVEPTAQSAAFTIPKLSITLKGAEGPSEVNLSKAVWKVVEAGNTQAVLAIDIQDGEGKPVLTVRRTYTLHPRAEPAEAGADAPPQYEFKMNLEFIPAGDRVEKVMYEISGSPELPVEPGRGILAAAVAATWASSGVQFVQTAPMEVAKGVELPKATNLAGTDLAWAGQMDKYFAVIMIPQKPSREGTFAGGAETEWYRVVHERADTAVPGVRIISREIPLAAGKPVEHQILVFAGPKDADLLERYYADLGLDKLIVWASPCCGGYVIPGVDTLSRLLAGLMDALDAVTYNYGIAIILLVLLLRLALHPVTRWSTKSMLEMQKMAPKMEAIRKQFADDKEKMQQEMAKIGGFKSFSGCLPMFIQMPIWIALYGALGAAIHLRHAAFIPADWLPAGSLFLQDLSSPDAMVAWQTPFFLPGREIPILGWVTTAIQGMLTGSATVGMTSFNMLPVLVGVSFYLQQKMTPQPAASSPQMEQQRKMMSFMFIFFALMMYGLPSGLCLYISASSFLGFFEQRYLKNHMAAREAAAAAAGPDPKEPSKPQPAASPKRLSSGRDKSIAERIQAWVNQRMGDDKGKKK